MFRLLRTIIFSSAVCSMMMVYCADTKTHKAWVSRSADEYAEAFTVNESQSTFGVLCGTSTCRVYMLTETKCDAGSEYPWLASGDLTMHVTAKCGEWGSGELKRPVYWIDEATAILKLLGDGKVVGFAMALKSGEFKVVRFSLNGYKDALERLSKHVAKLKKVNSERPRDSVQ